MEAINVIVRRETLERKYPGGLDAYATDCRNTFCADDHLTRAGFMNSAEVQTFIDRLVSLGFVFHDGEKFVDVAGVDQAVGVTAPCDWLQAGKFPEGFAGCWLKGTEDTWTAFPEDRTPESVVAAKVYLPPEGEHEFVRHERNLTILRHKETGELRYTARVRDQAGQDETKWHYGNRCTGVTAPFINELDRTHTTTVGIAGSK